MSLPFGCSRSQRAASAPQRPSAIATALQPCPKSTPVDWVSTDRPQASLTAFPPASSGCHYSRQPIYLCIFTAHSRRAAAPPLQAALPLLRQRALRMAAATRSYPRGQRGSFPGGSPAPSPATSPRCPRPLTWGQRRAPAPGQGRPPAAGRRRRPAAARPLAQVLPCAMPAMLGLRPAGALRVWGREMLCPGACDSPASL